MKKIILCCSAILVIASTGWAQGQGEKKEVQDCKVSVDTYMEELKGIEDATAIKGLSLDEIRDLRTSQDDCEVWKQIMAGVTEEETKKS